MKSETKKVLFYTHSPRAFRTTLIGYLYEICRVYPVILLSEKLDFETEKALSDKKLFPKLERIVPVNQPSEKKKRLFNENRYFFNMAKKAIKDFQPDIIISGSDMHSMFEMYLMRFAKKIKAMNIAISPYNHNTDDSEVAEKWVDLINSYLRFPAFLPLFLRLFLVRFRKYFGHFLYYWILPLSVGEKPFFGKSSYILRRGNSGTRDADYQIVFSKKDRDIFLKDGVPAEKLYILDHPLTRNDARKLFGKIYFNKLKIDKNNEKIIVLILSTNVELGFKRNDFSLIPPEVREGKWIEIIRLIIEIFPEWKIYIKPHPDTKNIEKQKEDMESISENIKFLDFKELADKYVAIADVIIGLPLSASTVLFTASLQCPEKPIISLDFFLELFGDYYKNFGGIEYIDNKDDFVKILKLIRRGKYKKSKMNQEKGGFKDAVELLEYLLKKRKTPLGNAG
jgi:hypothetical protein